MKVLIITTIILFCSHYQNTSHYGGRDQDIWVVTVMVHQFFLYFSYLLLTRVPTTVVRLCLSFDLDSYQRCWAARGNYCTIISLTYPYVPLFAHIFSHTTYLNPTSSTFVPHASLTQTTTLSPDIQRDPPRTL